MRRQKIRHLLLLILRCLALALLVAAFARPFFEQQHAGDRRTGAREVVILLDRSSSMGYADRWNEGEGRREESRERTRRGDHATLVVFANDASVASEPMATPDRINAAINAAKLSSEATRYAPALKLASQIIAASTLPRREVVLISDYQKVGWANHNEIVVPARARRSRPSTSAAPSASDIAVAQVTTDRDSTGDRDRVTVAARLDQHRRRAEDCRRDARRSAVATCRRNRSTVPPRGAQQVAFASDRGAEWRDEGRGAHHAPIR